MFNFFRKNSALPSSRDPVCGMQASEGVTTGHQGETYHFCSSHCREQFVKNPEAYADKNHNTGHANHCC